MYIHLGGDIVIDNNEIVGCFDIDKTTISGITRNFLKTAQDMGKIIHVNVNELPKSFIITEKDGNNKIYLSNLTVQTIVKRNSLLR